MNPTKEKLATSYLIQPPTRKNGGTASGVMRKYQQLALTIVSLVSLVAFVFYKHEYDRLRYTLEYLDMFGNSPADMGTNTLCGGNIKRFLSTAPHTWMKINDDIAVFSSFWDEGNGLTNPLVRTIALIKKSNKQQTELSSSIFFEAGTTSINAVCTIEDVNLRNHAKDNQFTDLKLVNLVCRPENLNRKNVPYLTQFKIGTSDWSFPLLVQESESWKSVDNISCVCIFSPQFPVTSLKIIEFISYYNILGVEKFVFYGSILTPLVRKLLDKYGDESSLFYEEVSFILPNEFSLNDAEMRTVIENDCIYRHRDSYENVIVLKLNEFLIPRHKNSLQEVLSAVGTKNAATVSEFHFVSQSVCIDEKHTKESELLIGTQIQSQSVNNEIGIAVLRPHFFDITFNSKTNGILDIQHVPSSVANIYCFEMCNAETHIDTDHLPTNERFIDAIKKSLLYRKWKINS